MSSKRMPLLQLFPFLWILFSPCFLSAQNIDLTVGVEFKPELLLQQTENYSFNRHWSADINQSVGTDIQLNYGHVGFGVGFFAATMGFNKHNTDSATGIFVRQRPLFIKNLKYRARYFEVPLNVHYRFTRKKLSYKIGLSYSFCWKLNSFIKSVNYYTYNMVDEKEAEELKEYLVDNALNKFPTISPYFELEHHLGAFSFSYKAGIKFYRKMYHEVLGKKPLGIYGSVSFNYFIIKKKSMMSIIFNKIY